MVFWSCQKQPIVSQWTTKAKFIVLMYANKEALWMLHFITEIFQPLNFLVKIYSGNQSAITIMHGNQQHSRTKQAF